MIDSKPKIEEYIVKRKDNLGTIPTENKIDAIKNTVSNMEPGNALTIDVIHGMDMNGVFLAEKKQILELNLNV